MKFQLLSLAVALAAGHAVSAYAQSDEATDLDDVLVTATRTAQPLSDSLVPAQVIDREEIQRSQARDLPDLLRGRAGIDIGTQGGRGTLSSVFVRGSESDHVLVLVDGVRIGSVTAGTAAFQDLPIEQIDRIEIVRGPRSSLYGSEAIGGVIQIFTRRDKGAVTPRLSAGLGSHGARNASAGIGGAVGRGWFGADFAYERTDGINACDGSATLFQGCFADEPDRDGYRNRSLSLRGGVDLTDTLSLDATALRAEADNEYDGSIYGGNEADNVQQAAGAKLTFTPSQAFKLTVQAGRSYDKSDSYFADAATGTRTYVGKFDTRRDTASAQGDFTLAEGHLLSGGVDWQDDRVTSETAYAVTSRDNLGAFLEYQGTFGRQRLQASARNDDNEQFGNHTTGGLGWGMDLGDGLRLNATYATGFKAPTFNELYFPFGSGNPDLDPERSKTLNLGIRQDRDAWRWTFDVYESRVDDLISLDAAFVPQNIEQARIRGAEFTVATTLAGWDIATQLSHTDPRNRSSGANHGNLLPRRARDTGRIDVDRAFGKFRFGTTLNGAGSRYDNAANSVRLGGYATWDLRAEYAFASAWTLQTRIDNALDKHYQTVDWYNQPGREYGITVRYAPTAK